MTFFGNIESPSYSDLPSRSSRWTRINTLVTTYEWFLRPKTRVQATTHPETSGMVSYLDRNHNGPQKLNVAKTQYAKSLRRPSTTPTRT